MSKINSSREVSLISKIVLALGITAIVLVLFPGDVTAFDPPDCGDPWYYQSNDRTVFWIPDKVQHYWGSYALNEVLEGPLGTFGGPTAAFALGVLWEIKDSKTSLGTANGGGGRSWVLL